MGKCGRERERERKEEEEEEEALRGSQRTIRGEGREGNTQMD